MNQPEFVVVTVVIATTLMVAKSVTFVVSQLFRKQCSIFTMSSLLSQWWRKYRWSTIEIYVIRIGFTFSIEKL